MDLDKQPDALARSKPEFRLGREAVEGATASTPASSIPNETPVPAEQNPKVDNDVPGVVNKPMAECYPEIAEDDNEQLIADVRRHWLGRFTIILTGAILTIFLIGFAIALPTLTKTVSTHSSSSLNGMADLLLILVGALIIIGTFITLWIYNQNRMLITDMNVVEVRQMGLFSHKVAHLNMINVEDVAVIKKGILQTFFNYGTMTIETAGEEENFAFPNTPNPDLYRKLVINAHEEAIEHIGQMGNVQRVELAHGGL